MVNLILEYASYETDYISRRAYDVTGSLNWCFSSLPLISLMKDFRKSVNI